MTVEYVIICRGWADGRPQPDYEGLFLKAHDIEWGEGRGRFDWTPNLDDAEKFASMDEIMELWRSVPKCHPVRTTDGKPNRPLTAFTIEIMPCTKDQSPS